MHNQTVVFSVKEVFDYIINYAQDYDRSDEFSTAITINLIESLLQDEQSDKESSGIYFTNATQSLIDAGMPSQQAFQLCWGALDLIIDKFSHIAPDFSKNTSASKYTLTVRDLNHALLTFESTAI